MANRKLIELPSGATAEYWKLMRFQPYPDRGVIEVYWDGWISEEHRASGKAPLKDAAFMETIEIHPGAMALLYSICTPPGSRLHGAEPILEDSWKIPNEHPDEQPLEMEGTVEEAV